MPETEEQQDEEKLELTPRELAIIAGEDPDAEPVEEIEDPELDSDLEDDEEGASEEEDRADASGLGDNDVANGSNSEAGKDAPSSDANWATGELRSLAGAYGLDDEDMSEFSSKAEFTKHVRLLERMSMKAAQMQYDKNSKASGSSDKSETDSQSEETKAFKIDPQSYADAGHDEDLVALAKVASDLQEKVAGLEKEVTGVRPVIDSHARQAAEDQHKNIMDSFHLAADAIGGRFGTAKEYTESHDTNRQRLMETALMVENHYKLSGQKIPSMEEVLRRAERIAFADEIENEGKASLAKKIKGQASRVRPAGRSVKNVSSTRSRGDSSDPIKAIAFSPEMDELFNSFEDS